jgi:hypothetical protein
MRAMTLLDPIELAKAFEIPQLDLAVRLGGTRDTVRRHARHPRYTRRVRLAVLEAILERERLAVAVESWLSPVLQPGVDHGC